MFVRVDTGEVSHEIEGFSFLNKRGNEERVEMSEQFGGAVLLRDKWNEELSAIFYEDIPNCIKALQAAYDKRVADGKLKEI